MGDVKRNTSGHLKISEDVIITVARLAALDVKGVAGLDGEVNKMSKLMNNGPVIVSMVEDVAALDIKIRVKHGFRVTNVAQEVQTAVKENVQSMTGVAVARVNVVISGIVF
ncbi:MAG: Asp23/Gls24 family envelope stress response protein [Ruminococcus flavefaciens]|nr:Asp23/Gls24 family envelope stress response protein [Ruminococcus flavefaciens]MCM1229725.1 Asp23/Gls24 family envelope stress response protein [Ruminococcus flavefaciens]